MEFVRLTEEEKKEVLNNLDSREKDAISECSRHFVGIEMQ